jgi:hypothetical protein
MPDEMVMDAPVETGIESTEPEISTTETPEIQADQQSYSETDTDAEAAKTAKQIKIFERANKFSPEVRAHLDELKNSKDPTKIALATAIRQMAFDHAKFADKLPEGLKEVESLRQLKEELGGEQGIQDLKHNSQEFARIDDLYTKGDPKFIDELTKEDVGREAFQRLTPSILSKIAEVSPEMYVANVARETVGWLNENNVPLMMMRLGDLLDKSNEGQVAAFNHIQKFLNLLQETAKKQPPTPAATTPNGKNNGEDMEAKFRQREEALRTQEWNSAVVSERTTAYESELRKLTQGRTLSEQQRDAVNTLFSTNLTKALQGDQNYAKQIAAHKANGDKDGFLRVARNAFAKYMPDALERAVKVVNHGAKPGPKPAATATPTNGQQKPGQPPPVPGAVFVSTKPTNIDYQRTQQYAQQNGTTAQDLIISKKAYTTAGKLVYWQ